MSGRDSHRAVRVLIFHQALAPYRVDLFNALAERTELQVVFLLENVPEQEFDQPALLGLLKAPYKYLISGKTVKGRTIRLGLLAEMKKTKPDVVVSTEFSPVTLSIATMKAVGLSRTRHVIWTDDNSQSVQHDTRTRRLIRRTILPRTDGLILLSHEAAALYRDKYEFRKPVGVCPILHRDTVFREGLMRARVHAAGLIDRHKLMGKRVVLYVGRLARVKRLHRVIDAFSAVRDLAPDTVLALVGDGPEAGSLRAHAETRGVGEHVIFPGRFDGDELKAWYLIGSVFVLTSVFEAFGAVINEALLSGMPVVCTDQAGARVLVQPGTTGSVLDASDGVALQRELLNWLRRTAPIPTPEIATLRPSLMATTFDDAVDGYVEVLERVVISTRDARELTERR